MTPSELSKSFSSILSIGDGPRPLSKYWAMLDAGGEIAGIPGDGFADAVLELLGSDPAALRAVHLRLIGWDAAEIGNSPWTSGTPASTASRRAAIYYLLEASPALRELLDTHAPVYMQPDITAISHDFEPWYNESRQTGGWYWPRYKRYLGEIEGWEPNNLALLNEASDEVLRRLADPHSSSPRATRGLVVGYVQSGKTANMTAVVAKAVDAGYRLIILLSGTTNLLRDQTQRRLDKQLIGVELVNPGPEGGDDNEYANDDDYAEFQRYGNRPSALGSVDWYRITTSRDDFRQVQTHLAALDITRADPAKPVYHPDNLRSQPAILVVAKKNASVLGKLHKALKRTQDAIVELPTIVLDDESDNASINTARPSAEEEKARTRVNGLIVDILKRLPRAQYVGYTATPFANVFINPDDAEDLFPKHFLISLPQPVGYMGAAQFHDMDGDGEPNDHGLSNTEAFVRLVRAEDEADPNLLSAIDAFVLSGAIKLYRADATRTSDRPLRFKHHTMLMHTSSRQADHVRDEEKVLIQLKRAGYEGGAGNDRLRERLEEFRKVSQDRRSDLPFPANYDDVQPFVGAALGRIYSGEGPVRIVNGTKDDPNFEQGQIWKILVGGNKLSRGYTVEGLTVSYFRRRSGSGDTLMQMGRWFGYRTGYNDLVRLYIGVAEAVGRSTYDLLQGFEGLLQTEEEFRQELARYALVQGQEVLTPGKLPPLVTSHVPWLAPTAPAKMWNAKLTYINFGGLWHEPTLSVERGDDIRSNAELFKESLAELHWTSRVLELGTDRMIARIATANPDTVMSLVGSRYRWLHEDPPVRHQLFLEFLRGADDRDPSIMNWLVLAPQLKALRYDLNFDVGTTVFTVKFRTRMEKTGRVKAYTEPAHKRIASYLTLGESTDRPNKTLAELRAATDRTAVLLFYPARHTDERADSSPITMGFAAICPANGMPRSIIFQAQGDEDKIALDRA